MNIFHIQYSYHCGLVLQCIFGIIRCQINNDLISSGFNTAELLFCGLAEGGEMVVDGQVIKIAG